MTPAAAAPAVEAPLVRVEYRETASSFEVLDNVSSWWEGRCEVEYRNAWRDRFGMSIEDEARFAAYKKIRKRYYEDRTDAKADPRSTPHGLFAPRKVPDRFARAFYEARDLADALARLDAFVEPEDRARLEGLFRAYAKPLSMLAEESRPLADVAAAMHTELTGERATALLHRMARAHGVSDVAPVTALFVWWPPVENVTANQRDDYLVLKYHPSGHRALAETDTDVVVHELVHYLSASRPDEAKQALTGQLLDACDVPSGMHPRRVIEEPLAVAHQRLFAKLFSGTEPDFERAWYGGDPWIDPFAKALYDPLLVSYERGGALDAAFFAEVGGRCRAVAEAFER